MKEKLRDKKVVYTIIGIISVLLVIIGITYAYWLVTKTQTNSNVISSACLDITLSDEANDISLTNQFPISDEDGMKLTPYEFTVTNNCNTSVDYQIALEAMDVADKEEISSSALKIALDDKVKLYSNYSEVTTTISGAYESRAIGYSRLAPSGSKGSSDTHSLRIWIDEDAPISEMNKTFQSKISVTIGQGLESVYKEGSLAYTILANNGGVGAVNILNTYPQDTTTASGNSYVSPTVNYYYGTDYTYNSSTGKYTLSGTLTQATLTECRNGTKTCGRYMLKSTSSTYASTTLYEVTDFQTSGNYVTSNTIKYTTPFSSIETVASLNKTIDDLGDSYYFRGAATDNYVQFGTFSSDMTVNYYSWNYEMADWEFTKSVNIEEGSPIYWRIVRINGDGTIRLIYDGTEKVANGVSHSAAIGTGMYNSTANVEHVGYTFDNGSGMETDSTVKSIIDAWYDTHLETSYGSYIADGIFCNDRESYDYYYYDEEYNETNEQNAVYTALKFGSYSRLITNKSPKLKCTREEDKYTTSTEKGNGLLSNPVGLLTADEAFFAGGTTSANNIKYYLYSGESYWTMSPLACSMYIHEGVYSSVWQVKAQGMLSEDIVNLQYNGDYGSVRPVINLKADVEFTGSGTYSDPYVITTE